VDRDRLNWFLTLTANIAVLVGIALVVVELSQNREMVRSQTRNDISIRLGELLSQQTDQDLSELILKAVSDFEGLTETEKARFQAHALSMLRYFENVHYQYRNGMYDAEEYLAQQEAWRRFMSNTPYVQVWCSWKDTFSPSFRETLEALRRSHEC